MASTELEARTALTAAEREAWSAAEPVLGAWYRRARESQFAHYAAAARYARLSKALGVPSLVLATAAGSTLFATLSEDAASVELRLVVGLVTMLAAVLTALQTFLGFGDLAERHRSTASRYGMIRRLIEQHQATLPAPQMGLEAKMDELRGQLDAVGRSAPHVPDRSWAKAQSQIAHTKRPEGFRRPGS